MNTRSATQAQPARLDSGVGDSRLATMAKITRSTSSASRRRPWAAAVITLAIPRRSHSRSATQAVPIGRESTICTSAELAAATASAGSRNRLMLLTSLARPSRSTCSARPKLWMIRALGIAVSGSRSLWANAK